MNDSSTGDETRPDGRSSSPETLRLRAATRALRLHLDELPAVFHFDGPGDQFLAESAFPFARFRYDCAESLIGAGFGGTVLGALARSLFVDGLRWQWIGTAPAERRATLLGSMIEERNRICMTLERNEATCPILPRWFAPISGITDMTGASMAWLKAPPMPDEDELLDTYLAELVSMAGSSPTLAAGTPDELLASARSMLAMAGLRGAVKILAHAGHGNLLGLQSSLTKDGGVGHDLRPDHEALFMQVAATGFTLTLLGVCVAVPESWPEEVQQQPFLEKALQLTKEVIFSATAIHGLGSPRPATPNSAKIRTRAGTPEIIRPAAILATDDLLPDINSAHRVAAAAETYYDFARSWVISPWENGNPKLATSLAYGGAHSSLESVMSTYDKNAAVVTVFAARMLLEEAARFCWLTRDQSDQEFSERSTQFFDEFRKRRKTTIELFSGNGVSLANARKLLELPDNVVIVTPQDSISKGRKPLPSIDQMLLEMGEKYPEPGWLCVAYSLLSQVTHSTPIGILHMARLQGGTLHANEISPELLGLALDVACLGSAHLLGLSSLMLTQGSQEAREYALGLLQKAYVVHEKARMVHGLD